MKNKELADIFSRMADVLEFKGEVIFKINAYRKASRILDELTDSVKDLVATDSLKDIPGIGKGL
ncbi:DNA polymerase III, partial [candidate division KSB1 bacterium]|nr:DNA polymerase III [candidate division KSB1 bacterium]